MSISLPLTYILVVVESDVLPIEPNSAPTCDTTTGSLIELEDFITKTLELQSSFD